MNSRSNKQLNNRRQRVPSSRLRSTEDRPLIVRESARDIIRNPDAGLARNLLKPTQYAVVPTLFRKIRFMCTVAIASQIISFQDLIKMQVFSTAANTGYAKVNAVRLRYVELWEPFQGGGQSTSVAGLTFEGSGGTNTGINRNFYAESVAPDYPSHLYATPPSDTLIGAWQQKTSTSNAFTLKNLDVGTTVDIAFDYQYCDDDATASLGPYTIVAASAGLNGIHSPTTSLVAQGLNNM